MFLSKRWLQFPLTAGLAFVALGVSVACTDGEAASSPGIDSRDARGAAARVTQAWAAGPGSAWAVVALDEFGREPADGIKACETFEAALQKAGFADGFQKSIGRASVKLELPPAKGAGDPYPVTASLSLEVIKSSGSAAQQWDRWVKDIAQADGQCMTERIKKLAVASAGSGTGTVDEVGNYADSPALDGYVYGSDMVISIPPHTAIFHFEVHRWVTGNTMATLAISGPTSRAGSETVRKLVQQAQAAIQGEAQSK
jgi:hypothetical protein